MDLICSITGKKFSLREKDLAFYKRMEVSVPSIHPDEILRKIMACRNEWKLYKRTCDKTKETMISAYRAKTPFPVYKNEVWWGDSWDGLDYGQAYNLESGFFEQFLALRDQVPREGTSVFRSENCDYNGHTRECKNCYLMGLALRCENAYYSYWVVDNKDIADCRMTSNSELCYDCVNCDGLFDCVLCQEVYNSSECYFSYQLRGCDHCIGCSNLQQKSYYVFNKKVSPEEFERVKNQILDGSYRTWGQGQEYFKKMWDGALHRYVHALNCEGSEGDILINSKNCWQSFETVGCEDCAYNVSSGDSKDVYNSHSAGWTGCELVYFSAVTRGSTDIRFCYYTWFCNKMTYCDSCVSCQDCFGCVGLKHKKYCILNKEYSKEEYFVLRDRIIAQMKTTPLASKFFLSKSEEPEWGAFPPQMSTFAYNQTAAQEYFPLSEAAAIKKGYKWKDVTEETINSTTEQQSIPDSIKDVEDTILDQTLVCETSGKNYNIQKEELALYRRIGVPIPRLCPEVRREERNWRINPYKLFSRECSQCQKEVLSSFAPDRTEKIVCEKCYLESIV